MIKPVLRFPLGSFGDLDRAKAGGAPAPKCADAETPEPLPEKVHRSRSRPKQDEKERVPAV